jgi:hypothetical protein
VPRNPIVRARLAWLIAGLMLAAASGDWEAARDDASKILDLILKQIDAHSEKRTDST